MSRAPIWSLSGCQLISLRAPEPEGAVPLLVAHPDPRSEAPEATRTPWKNSRLESRVTRDGLPAPATSAPAPAAAARALGELDLEHAAVHCLAVEPLDCLRRLLGRRHLDEAEAAR